MKALATCKIVVLLDKPFDFFTFSQASPSSSLKLPNARLGPEQLTLQVICFLPVLEINLAIKISERNRSLFVGEKESFYCFVEGPLPLTVRWLKDNRTIKERKSKRVKQVNLTLDFRELDLHHAGKYTCEASDRYNLTMTRTILVSVLCKHLLLTRLFSHPSPFALKRS